MLLRDVRNTYRLTSWTSFHYHFYTLFSSFFFLMIRPPPSSPLFPYPTLFRSFPPLLLLLQPLVLFHEPAPCPGECRSHGSDRQPERRRDLRIIQPFLSHQQRKAITLGEPIHRGARHRRLLPTLYRRLFRLDRAALPFLLNHRGRLAPAP